MRHHDPQICRICMRTPYLPNTAAPEPPPPPLDWVAEGDAVAPPAVRPLSSARTAGARAAAIIACHDMCRSLSLSHHTISSNLANVWLQRHVHISCPDAAYAQQESWGQRAVSTHYSGSRVLTTNSE